MAIDKEKMLEKAKNMQLSEIQTRLEEIANITSSNEKTVIDKVIDLNEEAFILNQVAKEQLGHLDKYLEEKSS